MHIKVGQLSELKGPLVRFAVILVADNGDELMDYPGWTVNVYRDVLPPATKTARGFYKRFTETSIVLDRMLLEALEKGFPEIEEILGPKQERPKNEKRVIVGEMKAREPKPRTPQGDKQVTRRRGYKGMGHVYLRGKYWWIKYYKDGKPFYESSGSIYKQDALELLHSRWGIPAQ